MLDIRNQIYFIFIFGFGSKLNFTEHWWHRSNSPHGNCIDHNLLSKMFYCWWKTVKRKKISHQNSSSFYLLLAVSAPFPISTKLWILMNDAEYNDIQLSNTLIRICEPGIPCNRISPSGKRVYRIVCHNVFHC